MSTSTSKPITPSASVRSEAAVWVARMHGAQRTSQVEAGLRRWLSESEERRIAFEIVTETWESAVRLPRSSFGRIGNRGRAPFRRSVPTFALAASIMAFLVAVAALFYVQRERMATDIGEQRILALQDGSRVYLNTDTELVDRYDQYTRRVELIRGEALFDVAKRADRPFVVIAGDREIRALGTQFIVRSDVQRLAVTLVEGKVKVTAVGQSSDTVQGSARNTPSAQLPAFTLSPGQRLTFERRAPPKVDTPVIERVTAWQRGNVVLDNTSLADAIAEMNRYSSRQLVVEEPTAASTRISGRFRAGDQEDFAHAIAKAYQLSVRLEPQEIVIVGSPGGSHATP